MSAQYPDDIKAAVLAALMAGQSIGSTAREYNLPKSTVATWKQAQDKGTGISYPKKAIGELLLEYLQENLTTLRAQAVVFRDADWLRAQSAESAAVLHGVMTDKAVRLLEAMSKANAEDPAA